MSKRKTFSDVKVGDIVEIRKDADKKGDAKKINSVSKAKYGTKVSVGDSLVFIIDNEQAKFVTEFYDSRLQHLYIVDQSAKKKNSD